MSATPLLDQENYTVSRAWDDEWNIYQEIEGTFQDWHIERRMEWNKSDETLRRDFMQIWKGSSNWYSVEVEGTSKGWRNPVTDYQIGFSGHGRLNLELAKHKLDLLNVGYAMALELTEQLKNGMIKAPKLSENQGKWTDLLTGLEHSRGK